MRVEWPREHLYKSGRSLPAGGQMKQVIICSTMLLGVAGCAVNGFEKYYSPQPGSETVPNNPRFEHRTGEPQIYSYSNDPKSDNQRALEDGYVLIGHSSFYGPPATMTRAQVIDEAKRVG